MCYVALFKTGQYRWLERYGLRRQLTVWTLFFCVGMVGYGQANMLQGQVIDEANTPVFAANVYLKQHPDQGTITELDGSFKLALPASLETDTLVVSFIGYQEWQQAVDDHAVVQPLTITLKEETNQLQTVTVKASASISEEFSAAQLKKLDIYLNPVSAADPLKAITTLAGSTNTDESANPNLRGSSFARSRVVLNGVPVVNPVRNSQINGIGNFSLFNTELIEFQNVYPGNPPIIYGNTSAGLVEIETRSQLKRNKYQATISMANLGLFASQKLNKNSFIQVYGNYQFPDLFLEFNADSFQGLERFGAVDYGVNWHQKIGQGWTFNLYNYGIDEGYRIRQNLFNYEGEALSSRWRNFSVANLKLQRERYWLSFNQGVDWSKSTFELGNLASDKSDAQYYSAVNYKQFLTNTFSVQTGLVYESSATDFDNRSPAFYFAIAPDAPAFDNLIRLRNELLEGYAYMKWEASNLLTIGGGIRKNIPLNGQPSYWSGQGNMRLDLDGGHAWVFGGGYYHNFTLPSFYDANYQLLSSRQVALEYFFKRQNWDIQLAGFYKKEQGDVRLLPGEPTSNHREIVGAEMRVDWQWKDRFRLTIANTFLNARIQNGKQSFRAQNDMDYFVKAVGSYTHPKLGAMAISYIHRPGLFFTPITGGSFVEEAGVFAPQFATAINSAQLPYYATLDFNYSKVIPLKGTSNVIVYVTVTNLLNRTNPRNYLHNADYSMVVDVERFQKRSFYVGSLFTLFR
jgi:hypothetical protein